MYLIQRISDGMWYTNRDYRWGVDPWIKEKNKCKPFMSTSGAKNSRGWTSMKQVPFEEARAQEMAKKHGYGPAFVEYLRREGNMLVDMLPEELPCRIVKVRVR